MALPYYHNPSLPIPPPAYFRGVYNEVYGPHPGKSCRHYLILEMKNTNLLAQR